MNIRLADLVIRPAISTDIDDIVVLWNNPAVMKSVGFPDGLKTTPDDIQKKLAGPADTLLNRILMVEHYGVCIGQAMMHSPDSKGKSSTDIKLFPERQGKGFGTAVKRRLINYLFENTSCVYVEATPNQNNVASIRMQESVGAIRVGYGRFQPSSASSQVEPIYHWIYRVYRNPQSQIDCRNRQFRYSAIIPAAGKSSRMGQCKHLLRWPPQAENSAYCVIESAILSLMHAGVDPVIVVVGYWKDIIRRRLKDWQVTIVDNSDFQAPMSHSVQLGLTKIPDRSAVLVLPGDHPSVDSETIRHLIDLHEKNPEKIYIPVYNSKGGHPTLFPPIAISEISRGDLPEGLRSIIRNPAFSVTRIPVSDSGVLKNVNTPEDYNN